MANKVHVLYADDDQMIRKIIGGQLAKKGYEVIYAEDGNQARDIARRMKPDLVMLDYRMPVFDGLTTAKYLKGEEPTKHLPIILMTNEDLSVEGQKMWSDGGFDAYIHKSSGPEEFFKKVEEVLTKYHIEIPTPQQPGGPKE